jgi:hypothetical protein
MPAVIHNSVLGFDDVMVLGIPAAQLGYLAR